MRLARGDDHGGRVQGHHPLVVGDLDLGAYRLSVRARVVDQTHHGRRIARQPGERRPDRRLVRHVADHAPPDRALAAAGQADDLVPRRVERLRGRGAEPLARAGDDDAAFTHP